MCFYVCLSKISGGRKLPLSYKLLDQISDKCTKIHLKSQIPCNVKNILYITFINIGLNINSKKSKWVYMK